MISIVDKISMRHCKVCFMAISALALCLYAEIATTLDLEAITRLFGERNAYVITQAGGSVATKNLGIWQQFVVCVHRPK